MRLRALQPGVSIREVEVQDRTGFDLPVHPNLRSWSRRIRRFSKLLRELDPDGVVLR
jgi:hypothetical protein